MSRLRLLALPLLASGLLSACVVAPYPRQSGYGYAQQGYGQPVPYDGGVEVAPPAPYVEVIPVLPFAGAIWLSGFWNWHGGRHHWTPGRYERGRPGYGYRPHAWSERGGRWHQQGGGWERRH